MKVELQMHLIAKTLHIEITYLPSYVFIITYICMYELIYGYTVTLKLIYIHIHTCVGVCHIPRANIVNHMFGNIIYMYIC